MDFGLDERTVDKSPFLQFRKWYSYAIMNNVQEAAAMVLSTSSPQGKPSSRVVYMRDLDDTGLVFFTNYRSRKARDISFNPDVALNFFWQPLGRQVRIEGKVSKVNAAESDAYFSLRERPSKIGAWASSQSDDLESRELLEGRFNSLAYIFEGQEVIRPEWWGGYKVSPNYFEFWLGRDSRLHDRVVYILEPDGNWKIKRIAP